MFDIINSDSHSVTCSKNGKHMYWVVLKGIKMYLNENIYLADT